MKNRSFSAGPSNIVIGMDETQSALAWTIVEMQNGKVVMSGDVEPGVHDLAIDCSDLERWSPNSPRLYEYRLSEDGAPVFTRRFGLAGLSVSQEQLFLNGNPLYVRGYIRGLKAHECVNSIFADKGAFYEYYIRTSKAYGFNLARWHSTIPDEEYLDLSDELGLLNHVEFSFKPIWGKDEDGGNVLLDVELNEEDIRATVSRLVKHPSVAIYCVGNEIHSSGGRDGVRRVVDIIRSIDPHKLILDNCGWGEYDRETSDFFSQHMGYYFPFGRHRDMFDVLDVFGLDGSISGPTTVEGEAGFEEAINVCKPVVAHEVLHYISWHDTANLRASYKDPQINVAGLPEPWWLDEVIKLEEAKGITGERRKAIVAASRHFDRLCTKEAVERIRMSPCLQGFEMLQFMDTQHYENGNGLLDSFGRPKFVEADDFRNFNDDAVLLIDLTKRCFTSAEECSFKVMISNFLPMGESHTGDLEVSLGEEKFVVRNLKLQRRGVYTLGDLKFRMPSLEKPSRVTLLAKLETDKGMIIRNSWDVWVFPGCTPKYADDCITTEITEDVISRVANGASLLCLFNPEVYPVGADSLGFPYVRDHFKPVIWDRGHQLGAVVRDHTMLGGFPHDDCMDFQFSDMVEGAVKVNLDGFPADFKPVMEGIDRPVRDRMLVIKGDSTGFDPELYMRKFGYLFEIGIGSGRMVVCTLRLTSGNPESDWLLSALVDYTKNTSCQPAVCMQKDALKSLLTSMDNARIHEPPMNEYWERDDEPVETKLFWEEVGVDITKL